jgi:hypothetical protein
MAHLAEPSMPDGACLLAMALIVGRAALNGVDGSPRTSAKYYG